MRLFFCVQMFKDRVEVYTLFISFWIVMWESRKFLDGEGGIRNLMSFVFLGLFRVFITRELDQIFLNFFVGGKMMCDFECFFNFQGKDFVDLFCIQGSFFVCFVYREVSVDFFWDQWVSKVWKILSIEFRVGLLGIYFFEEDEKVQEVRVF